MVLVDVFYGIIELEKTVRNKSDSWGIMRTLSITLSTRLKNSKVVPKNVVTVCPTLNNVLLESSTYQHPKVSGHTFTSAKPSYKIKKRGDKLFVVRWHPLNFLDLTLLVMEDDLFSGDTISRFPSEGRQPFCSGPKTASYIIAMDGMSRILPWRPPILGLIRECGERRVNTTYIDFIGFLRYPYTDPTVIADVTSPFAISL